jgi:hypothetical protein
MHDGLEPHALAFDIASPSASAARHGQVILEFPVTTASFSDGCPVPAGRCSILHRVRKAGTYIRERIRSLIRVAMPAPLPTWNPPGYAPAVIRIQHDPVGVFVRTGQQITVTLGN